MHLIIATILASGVVWVLSIKHKPTGVKSYRFKRDKNNSILKKTPLKAFED